MDYISGYCFDTEKNRGFINGIFRVWNKVCLELAKIRDSCMESVEIWCFNIPKGRIFQSEIQVSSINCTRVDLHFLFADEDDFIISVFGKIYLHQCNFIFQRFIVYFDLSVKISKSRSSLCIVLNFFGITKDAVICNMQLGHMKQFYTAENTGACIPAGIRLHAGIYDNGYSVRFSKVDVWSYIY